MRNGAPNLRRFENHGMKKVDKATADEIVALLDPHWK
jgi:hypothetical protein